MVGRDGAVSNRANHTPSIPVGPNLDFRVNIENLRATKKRSRDIYEADSTDNNHGGDSDHDDHDNNDSTDKPDQNGTNDAQDNTSSSDKNDADRPKHKRQRNAWPQSSNLVRSPTRTHVKLRQDKTRRRRDRQAGINEERRFGVRGTRVQHLQDLAGRVQAERESQSSGSIACRYPALKDVTTGPTSVVRDSPNPHVIPSYRVNTTDNQNGRSKVSAQQGDDRPSENDNADQPKSKKRTRGKWRNCKRGTHNVRVCDNPEHNDRYAENLWFWNRDWDGNADRMDLPPCPSCNGSLMCWRLVDCMTAGMKRARTPSPERASKRIRMLSPSGSPTSATNSVLAGLGLLHLFDPPQPQPQASKLDSHPDDRYPPSGQALSILDDKPSALADLETESLISGTGTAKHSPRLRSPTSSPASPNFTRRVRCPVCGRNRCKKSGCAANGEDAPNEIPDRQAEITHLPAPRPYATEPAREAQERAGSQAGEAREAQGEAGEGQRGLHGARLSLA